jgi:hypothetical protein
VLGELAGQVGVGDDETARAPDSRIASLVRLAADLIVLHQDREARFSDFFEIVVFHCVPDEQV